MSALENLAPYIKGLRGWLPVNKPKGACSIKTLYALRLDADFTIHQNRIRRRPVEVYCARQLDPFASGLITFVFNQSNYQRRNFVHAEYKYRTKVEFGVDRELNCIDGKILGYSDVKHLNVELIQDALTHFLGDIDQKFNSSYRGKTTLEDVHGKAQSEIETIYNQIELFTKEKPNNQKYPFVQPKRRTTCFSLNLLEFESPFATLELHCKGGLNVRQLAVDLGEKLRTKASLVELTRTQEGPISLDDLRVIPFHELNLEQYIHKMRIYAPIYDKYVSQFDELFESDLSYRPRM